jgi:hypothetical protein
MIYEEFEKWLNMYGKNITVGKSNKTLHSVLARWTLKDDDKSRKTVESKCIGSKEEEEEGYNSDRGYNLLSKTWSREEREKQNRNKGREVERADEALRGNKDNIEGKLKRVSIRLMTALLQCDLGRQASLKESSKSKELAELRLHVLVVVKANDACESKKEIMRLREGSMRLREGSTK